MTDWHDHTATELGALIESSRADPRELAAHFIERAEAERSLGTVFVRLTKERATREAQASADRAKRGLRRSPLDGVPISWKDLFDTSGDITEGGSKQLEGRVPTKDATVLARATQAGLVCIGKTSMTEFAFSGLGINPTCGTPHNYFDPEKARVAGGSSAGAAVSVAARLAPAAMGTDTGGSVRIPAAWNGLVGLKTTAGLLPNDGVLPLSVTLDTVGPLTRDVPDANQLFGILAGERPADLEGAGLRGVHICVLANTTISDLVDPAYAAPFEAACTALGKAGATLREVHLPSIDHLLDLVKSLPGPAAPEAYAVWGAMLEAAPEKSYAFVRDRIFAGRDIAAADMIRYALALETVKGEYLKETAGFDAVLLPTMGLAPPPIADLIEDGKAYGRANFRALSLTMLANQLGLCGLTLPSGLSLAGSDHPPMPSGLSLWSAPYTEKKLLRLGAACEAALLPLNH